MGIFDIFRAARDVENVRLHLHFVHPAYEAARAVVEDARLHWWDRDDGRLLRREPHSPGRRVVYSCTSANARSPSRSCRPIASAARLVVRR